MSVERLAPAVRELLRAEIAAARGREVSFVASLDANGLIVDARVVARGTVDAVLALPGIAVRGELLLHNHPSGVLEPSGADLSVAARLHDGGVGFAIVDNGSPIATWWSSARGRAPPPGSTRSTSRLCFPPQAPWPGRSATSRIAPASAT